jgi:CheY-like chemotaxis protein
MSKIPFVSQPRNRARLHILIIEDNSDAAEMLAVLLRMYGYDVGIAANAMTALEMVQTETPDVVLLDLGLPGMDGYELARRLSNYRPGKTPLLIAVTGYGREEDVRRSAEAGIDLHMLKPVDPVQLQTVLNRFQKAVTV